MLKKKAAPEKKVKQKGPLRRAGEAIMRANPSLSNSQVLELLKADAKVAHLITASAINAMPVWRKGMRPALDPRPHPHAAANAGHGTATMKVDLPSFSEVIEAARTLAKLGPEEARKTLDAMLGE